MTITDCIKEKLTLLRTTVAAVVGTLLVVPFYNLKPSVTYLSEGMLALFLIYLSIPYKRLLDELKGRHEPCDVKLVDSTTFENKGGLTMQGETTKNIDWKKLEDEVSNAIKEGCPIIFDSRPIEECKYQQKVAENIISRLGIWISVIIFLAAIGVSFVIAVDALKDLIAAINNKDLKYMSYLFIGFIFLGIAVFNVYRSKQEYNAGSRIILDAEKRILSEGSKEQ